MRRIPDDNLAYAVLVKIGNAQGSGFFLNGPSSSYLITAEHVLFTGNHKLISNTATITSLAKDPNEHAVNEFKLDLDLINKNGHLFRDHAKDIAAVRIATTSPGANIASVDPGVAYTGITVSGTLWIVLCIPAIAVVRSSRWSKSMAGTDIGLRALFRSLFLT